MQATCMHRGIKLKWRGWFQFLEGEEKAVVQSCNAVNGILPKHGRGAPSTHHKPKCRPAALQPFHHGICSCLGARLSKILTETMRGEASLKASSTVTNRRQQ